MNIHAISRRARLGTAVAALVVGIAGLAATAPADETERLIAAALVPIVTDASTAALRSLYPDAPALGESAQTMTPPPQ